MTEVSLARRMGATVGLKEEVGQKEPIEQSDQFYFNPDYLNRTIEIEGFGKVEITPEGPIRITSEQLIHLKEFEAAHKDRPASESLSLEDGTFLVSITKE